MARLGVLVGGVERDRLVERVASLYRENLNHPFLP